MSDGGGDGGAGSAMVAEKDAINRVSKANPATVHDWHYGFTYGTPYWTFAHSVHELMKTQIEWNDTITQFSSEQIEQGRRWINEISHVDLKDPVLFILACKVKFEEEESQTAFNFKNKTFDWYTNIHKVSKIESWYVYQYKKLLDEVDERS